MSETHQHDHGHQQEHGHDHGHANHPVTAEEWDARYSGEPVWSGNPNQALVAEAAGLTPGTALDIGCGEGADAVWLAQQGWRVTGLDISTKAVEHTRRAAEAAGLEVTGVVAPFAEARLDGPFDLVSAMYPVLVKEPGQAMERRLADLVAPGGTLLYVHHTPDPEQHFDASGLVGPGDMADFLGGQDDWQIVTDEQRERHLTTGGGAGHHADLVVRARRLG